MSNVFTVGEIADLVRKEMRGKLPEGVVLNEQTCIDDLGLSSLQLSEIVFTLEENHGIELDPARAADVRTLGDLVELGNSATSTSPR